MRSPAEQRDDYDTDVAREGWQAGEAYAEKKAVSASRYSKKTRGDFQQLLDDLDGGRFAAELLWLWESSRGSRKVSEWVVLLELCEQHGVVFYVHTHGRTYDPGNARDRRTLLEDAVDAEWETAKSSERIKRVVRARANDGRPHGRNLYGYRREYRIRRNGSRELIAQVPDEDTASIVKEIFERIADGEGSQMVATSLTKRGIPTPRTATVWRKTSVHQIARNPAYLGERHHKRQLAKADAWEPLVDRALYDRANAMLSRPERRPDITEPRIGHVLSGIARCGKCGGKMRWSGGGRSNRPMYFCDDHHCIGRDASKLEGYVIPRVVAILAREQVAVSDDPSPALIEAEAEVQALRTRLESFDLAAAEGQISGERLSNIERHLAPKITAAERRVKALRVPRLLSLAKLDGPVQQVWDDLDMKTRRELIANAVEVTVYPVGMGKRNFDPSKVTIDPL